MRQIALGIGLGALALGAPAVAETGERGARPAIWSLADDDTRIYLFGTNHILPAGFVWRSAGVDRVIDEAEELVLEIADEQYSKPSWMYRAMALDPPRPILDRVDPAHRRRLEMVLKRTGAPIASFDAMQTWAVGFMLMGLAYDPGPILVPGKPDASGTTGVEIELTEIFERADKPISGIESTPEQLGFFGNLSEESQSAFLQDMVADMVESEAAIEAVEDNWVSGDIEELGAECDSEEAFSAELRDVLLRRRNRAWTDWLIARLDRPGTLLFAVGACHLAGVESVQAMLSARGFEAVRVE